MSFGYSKIFGRHSPQALIPRFAIGQGGSKAVYGRPYDPYQNRALRGQWNVNVGNTTYDILPRDWTYQSGSVMGNATGAAETDRYNNTYPGIKMDRDGRIYPLCSLTGITSLTWNCPGWHELNGARSWIIDFGVPMPTPKSHTNFDLLYEPLDSQRFRVNWTSDETKYPQIEFGWPALSGLTSTGIPMPTIYPEVGTTKAALPANQQPFVAPLEISRLGAATTIMRTLDLSHVNGQQHRQDTLTAFARYMPGDRCTGYKGSKGILSTTEKVAMMNDVGCGYWYQSGQRDDDTLFAQDVAHIASNLSNPFVVLEKSNEPWNNGFQQFQDDMVDGIRAGYGGIPITTDSNGNPTSGAETAPSLASDPAYSLQYPVIFDARQPSIKSGTGFTLTCAVPDRNYVVLGMTPGTSVFQAIGAKNTGDPTPFNWSSSTAYTTGQCAYIKFNQTTYYLKVAIVDVPGDGTVNYTNTAYWADATPANSPWVIAFNADQTSTAGQRYHMEQSRKLWQAGADAFRAVGKRRPLNILNLQLGGTPPTDQFYDRVNFGTGYKLLDAVAFGVYLGFTGNDPGNGGNRINAVSFTSRASAPWDRANRVAMYDLVTNGRSGTDGANEAVTLALQNYYTLLLNVGVPEVVESMVNFLNDTVQYWYDHNHLDLGKKIGLAIYEYNLQGIFTSGWPCHSGAYSNTKSYGTDPSVAANYITATDPSTGQKTLYRCIRPIAAGDNINQFDTSYWEKIPNSNGRLRLEDFFIRLWEHPMLAEVHRLMFDTLSNQVDSFVIMGFCTANQVPQKIGDGLSTFTIRPKGDRVDVPSWQRFVTDRDRMIAKGGFKP